MIDNAKDKRPSGEAKDTMLDISRPEFNNDEDFGVSPIQRNGDGVVSMD